MSETDYRIKRYDLEKERWIMGRKRFCCLGDLVKYAKAKKYHHFDIVEGGHMNYEWHIDRWGV